MMLLLTGAFPYQAQQLDQLRALGFELVFIQEERASLGIDVSNIDAVICNSLFQYNSLDLFENLKMIQLTSAGLDRIPVETVKTRNIVLFNGKGVYSNPIAEWVVLKILEIYKKSRHFEQNQKLHRWEKQRDLVEMTGRTAIIIGFGDVGQSVAKRLKAFDMRVIGADLVRIQSDQMDEFCLMADLNQVLARCDVVILTLPLTAQTFHMVDQNMISQMKQGCILINAARGGLIDEQALINALQSDRFSGVALDVFESEPLDENSHLWDFERVHITPHNAFVSDQVQGRLFEQIVENLKQFMDAATVERPA